MGSLDVVYQHRFGDRDAIAKYRMWRVIVQYLQRWLPEDGVVLDIACDRGYFIGCVKARERWASDVRDVSASLPPEVHFLQCDGRELLDRVDPETFDAVFMSNYLEHLPSSDAVLEQLAVCARLLRPAGRLMILQPNIRLTGAAYWDFIDHRTPLTERSLVEAAEIAGFRTVTVKTRFLPYTTKGRLPSHHLLVRAYLALPPLWRLLGGQTLYVGERR